MKTLDYTTSIVLCMQVNVYSIWLHLAYNNSVHLTYSLPTVSRLLFKNSNGCQPLLACMCFIAGKLPRILHSNMAIPYIKNHCI